MSNWSRDLYGVQKLSEVSASVSINSGVLSLDLSTANVFNVSLNSSVNTFYITNYPATGVGSFTLILTADGTPRSIIWTGVGTFNWPGGTAPTLTSTNNKKDIFTFITLDSGSNWYGFTAGQNF